MSAQESFRTLKDVAEYLRGRLDVKKYILLFAHNGIGKTRLSMSFRKLGKNEGGRDTLYYNAFTEDLFTWDNDLENDNQHVLRINSSSRFVAGMRELEMESRIREFLPRYADFDFVIDYENSTVAFDREVKEGARSVNIDHIKISRGEENLFIWCFFLAVAKLAIDGEDSYSWVKYLYIDDPISSLDDNNAIAVAAHLADMLKHSDGSVKTVVSSHHALFFNVIYNALSNAEKYFMGRLGKGDYTLKSTSDTPAFLHVALLLQLHEAAESGEVYTYHFNILRNVLEKTAAFHGYRRFSDCIPQDENDPEGIVHRRIVNLLSHGNYSLFEPQEMVPDNKRHSQRILDNFMSSFRFNPDLFPQQKEEAQTQ